MSAAAFRFPWLYSNSLVATKREERTTVVSLVIATQHLVQLAVEEGGQKK
jgi:hypothetical protein